MSDDLIRDGWLTADRRLAVNGAPVQSELELQLIERAADAIVFHPGNRAGAYELRRDVSLELARTVLKALRPELDELVELRQPARALAVSWSEWDETVPPRDRIMRDLKELTEVADPEHRARRHARTSTDLDAYRAQVIGEVEAKIRTEADEWDGWPEKQGAMHFTAELVAGMTKAVGE